MIVGVDEAGRGPLAGAVVACALHLENNPRFEIKDSKALSARSREEVFSWLIANSAFAVGVADAREIDKINILEATFLAFNRAIIKLIKKRSFLRDADFIIDGTMFKTKLNLNYSCLKKADETVREVSCASIVAKVVRDHLVGNIDFLYPHWSFREHKGYPTAKHFSLIKKHALTPFHRRSFSPCKKS